MAFSSTLYRGVIDGKDINTYSMQKLDYSTKDVPYRIEMVKKVLNLNEEGFSEDEFWQEIFDLGVCKTNLSKADCLWSETNVCAYLERLSSYIIDTAEKVPERERLIIYNTYTEFKRALQESKKIRKCGDVVEFENGKETDGKPIIMLKNQRNHKRTPDPKILKEDYEKYPELVDYREYKEYLMELMNSNEKRLELLEKLKKYDMDIKLNTKEDIHRLCKRQLKKVSDDMFELKKKKERPIVWKSPLRDSNSNPLVDDDCIDLFDPIQVKALLSMSEERRMKYDLNPTIDKVLNSLELKEHHQEVLDLWKRGNTQREIAQTLGRSDDTIRKYMNLIIKNFINEYEKIYEDEYYYLSVCKGKFKTCSQCGEVKLTNRFTKNSHSKDGIRTYCKVCEGKQKRRRKMRLEAEQNKK